VLADAKTSVQAVSILVANTVVVFNGAIRSGLAVTAGPSLRARASVLVLFLTEGASATIQTLHGLAIRGDGTFREGNLALDSLVITDAFALEGRVVVVCVGNVIVVPAAATVLACQVACTDALAQISGSTLGTAAEVLGGTIHLVGPLHAHSTVLALVPENRTHRRSRGRISERIRRITEFVGEGFAGCGLSISTVGGACVAGFAMFSIAILAKERLRALTVILGNALRFVLDLTS
jgi:hypothetical protein